MIGLPPIRTGAAARQRAIRPRVGRWLEFGPRATLAPRRSATTSSMAGQFGDLSVLDLENPVGGVEITVVV